MLSHPLLCRSAAAHCSFYRITDDEAMWEGLRASTPGAAHCVHFNNAGPSLTALRVASDHAQNPARFTMLTCAARLSACSQA